MHRKLRNRFFFISWILLVIFLAAICAGVSLYLYQATATETETELRKAVETVMLADSTRGMVSFKLGENGIVGGPKMIAQRHLHLSDKTLVSLASRVVVEDEPHTGRLVQDGMRYLYYSVNVEGYGYAWVVIVECSKEQALVKTLRRNSILFLLIGSVLLIPVCILLTR